MMRVWLLGMAIAACSAGGSSTSGTPATPLPVTPVPIDAAPVAVVAVVAVDAGVVKPDVSAMADNLLDVPMINEQSNLHTDIHGVGAGAPARSRDPGVEAHVSITPLGASDDAVLRVVRARMGIYRACYQKALNRDAKLAGRLEMRIDIGVDGIVASVTQTGATVGVNDEISACLTANLKRLRFPANDARKPVYAFDFSSTLRPGY